jgi:uncharacterized protein YbjT (DUF2867 family)
MNKVILFGSTGNLGKEIAKELVKRSYDLTVAVRNDSKAKSLSNVTSGYIIVDVCNSRSIKSIQDKYDIIVSALGKSVSPKDKSKPSFEDVDLNANSHILDFALTSGARKFVYVSAFHSEKYLHLEYFKVHHDFSERLKQSGLDFSIIKPPAIFSAFLDLIEMAAKGQLVNIGEGDKKTNPIYEGDLAKIVVDSISKTNVTVEAGGKNIYTRRQINEIVQFHVNNRKKIRTIPLGIFKILLPIIKIFSKNTFDKFAFFIEVMQHDTIAPLVGEKAFEDYVKQKLNV